ncbi:hypothetical protein D3C84_800850 [compost metagenome]
MYAFLRIGGDQQFLQAQGFAQVNWRSTFILQRHLQFADQFLDALLAGLVAVAAQQKQDADQGFHQAANGQRVLQAFEHKLVVLLGMFLQIASGCITGEAVQYPIDSVETQLLGGIAQIAVTVQCILDLVGEQRLPGQERVVRGGRLTILAHLGGAGG